MKGWDFFDDIRCINLTSRSDRYKQSKKIFDKYNIPTRYYFTEKHPKGGQHGCFESHINIIKEAYNNGCENVLIFEDDIYPTDFINRENLAVSIDFMKQNKWDLFYLGALPDIRSTLSQKVSNKIYKLHGICTHAYVVNRSGMKKLKDLKFTGVPIDYYYINNIERSYALYPTMFLQGLSKSDIKEGDNWWTPYSTPERVKTFYRCVEWYAYYINYPLSILFFLLGIIIVWLIFNIYDLISLFILVFLLFILLMLQQ